MSGVVVAVSVVVVGVGVGVVVVGVGVGVVVVGVGVGDVVVGVGVGVRVVGVVVGAVVAPDLPSVRPDPPVVWDGWTAGCVGGWLVVGGGLDSALVAAVPAARAATSTPLTTRIRRRRCLRRRSSAAFVSSAVHSQSERSWSSEGRGFADNLEKGGRDGKDNTGPTLAAAKGRVNRIHGLIRLDARRQPDLDGHEGR